jgi:methyl halide transferase
MKLNIHDTDQETAYWAGRYADGQTGWDLGAPAPALRAYFDQLPDRDLRILIPGAGNAYEAEYLHQQGFTDVTVLDLAAQPLQDFARRVPDFPQERLVQGNFFDHEGVYDLVVEQTFFCSFPPLAAHRHDYARTMARLIKPGGKLMGLWFDIPLTGDLEKRPFGGTREEYIGYFEPFFTLKYLDRCYNSIPPRAGNELFGLWVRK